MVHQHASTEPERLLKRHLAKTTPGIQYIVANKHGTVFEFAGGWADIQNQKPMSLNSSLMAYSMTKTFTALAMLQLAEQGKLKLDDPIKSHLPDSPYPEGITIHQVITHTSGIPNPIPLRWVHPAEGHPNFDEHLAFAQVLKKNAKAAFPAGTRFAYSNLGYWLLGMIIEGVTKQSYVQYVSDQLLAPLGLSPHELAFLISDFSNHAKGYLGKYSIMNLVKGLITDNNAWGDYEGNWLRVKNLYVNGPAFGGLVGNARAFIRFLQDQLGEGSALLGPASKKLFYTEQTIRPGGTIDMTPGWHIGNLKGTRYFFKEGGGGGFHSEMRIYPTQQLASVIMVNSTEFNSNESLSKLDETFLA